MSSSASSGSGVPPRLVLATQNRGKAREFEAFFLGRLRVESLADHPEVVMPEEAGATFEANARQKAEHIATVLGLPALGDDSGLAVDALAGAPGVHSARYAEGTDKDRYNKLLSVLQGIDASARTARFVCALAFAAPGAHTAVATGEVRGEIAASPRGEGGFGYDPVFLPAATPGRTMAELSPAEKQAISHRGEALLRLQPTLLAYFSLAAGGAPP